MKSNTKFARSIQHEWFHLHSELKDVFLHIIHQDQHHILYKNIC
jgi:hypothetical protein